MRMWMVDPEIMCMKHLCLEHMHLHMFKKAFKNKRKLAGFIANNLLEPQAVAARHKLLSEELTRRKDATFPAPHRSPLEEDYTLIENLENKEAKIDQDKALKELLQRCSRCKRRYEQKTKNMQRLRSA